MRTTLEPIRKSRADDIMETKDEISSKLQHNLSADIDEYDRITTGVGIVDIADAPENTIIGDIARERETESRRLSEILEYKIEQRNSASSYPAKSNSGSRRIRLTLRSGPKT